MHELPKLYQLYKLHEPDRLHRQIHRIFPPETGPSYGRSNG